MRRGVRAWPSVAMLAGFGLVAVVQLALVTVPVWLLLSALRGSAALGLGVPLCIATVGVMGSATWRALHRRRSHPAGIAIGRDDAPRLWALAGDAARAAGVRPPDRITVVADPSAALIEHGRLLGLVGGRRELHLGMPLMQAWDLARLRAAVAHELAHGSTALGRLAPVAHRGRVAVGRTIPRIPRNNPAGPLLRMWAAWYRRVDTPFSRAQELNADRIAAEFAGADAAAAVLRDGPALETLVHVFQTEYVAPGRRAGYVPDDLFGGLLHVLAARADEMAVLRHREPPDPSAWDSHPPRRDRLAALSAEAPDSSRAGDLVGAATGRQVTTTEAADTDARAPGTAAPADARAGSPTMTATEPGILPPDPGASSGVTRIGGYTPAGRAASGGVSEAGGYGPADRGAPEPVAGGARYGPADAGVSTGATTTGGRGPGDRVSAGGGTDVNGSAPAGELVPDLPGLARALQAVAFPAQGRATVGWDGFFGAARTAEMEREADAALSAISRAAGMPVRSAADVLDLAGDGRLRKAAETIFPELPADETGRRVGELVTLVLALAALRAGAARWRHSWTGAAELVTPDGGHLDLGRLATLAADPATADAARERLARLGIDLAAAAAAPDTAVQPEAIGGVVNLVVDGHRTDMLIMDTGLLLIPGLPRSQNGSAKRRLAELAGAGVRRRDLTDPSSRFLPYADLAGAAQTRRTPKGWELRLRAGGTVTVRTALDSDELPGGWAALDDAIAFLGRADHAGT